MIATVHVQIGPATTETGQASTQFSCGVRGSALKTMVGCGAIVRKRKLTESVSSFSVLFCAKWFQEDGRDGG